MRKADGFQIIEYIRSSIEIIMNLKVEDLEREILSTTKRGAGNRKSSLDMSLDGAGVLAGGGDSLDSVTSSYRFSPSNVNPKSFVLASMKEALQAASSVK